jgi:hypothetical protein
VDVESQHHDVPLRPGRRRARLARGGGVSERAQPEAARAARARGRGLPLERGRRRDLPAAGLHRELPDVAGRRPGAARAREAGRRRDPRGPRS